VRYDLGVTKSQHPVTLAPKPNVAITISRHAQAVLCAIRFDDYLAFQARKVRDIAANRLLAAKLPAPKLTIPQVAPQNSLCHARFSSKRARAFCRGLAAG
jgi:hypothetical protein